MCTRTHYFSLLRLPSLLVPPPPLHPPSPNKRARSPNGACTDDFPLPRRGRDTRCPPRFSQRRRSSPMPSELWRTLTRTAPATLKSIRFLLCPPTSILIMDKNTGLSCTGNNCLDTPFVIGCNRVPGFELYTFCKQPYSRRCGRALCGHYCVTALTMGSGSGSCSESVYLLEFFNDEKNPVEKKKEWTTLVGEISRGGPPTSGRP